MPTITALQLNGRKSNIVETEPERDYDRRAPFIRKYLESIRPAIWGSQEFTVEMCDDVMRWFPNWTYAGGVRFGNSALFWDTTIMHAEDGTLLERKYPSDKVERYMNLIRLTHKASGHGVWLGSLHLAAGGPLEQNEAALRKTQMLSMITDAAAWVAGHPYPADGTPNMVICADLNDNLPDDQGVRKIARAGGWKPLRTRIKEQEGGTLDTFHGDTYRTFHGWDHHTSSLPHDSKAIDEVFTRGVSIVTAYLRRTCRDVFPIDATDHNGYEVVVNI